MNEQTPFFASDDSRSGADRYRRAGFGLFLNRTATQSATKSFRIASRFRFYLVSPDSHPGTVMRVFPPTLELDTLRPRSERAARESDAVE